MGIKISALPAIATPALTDIFPVVQAGVTYKETVQQLSDLIGGVVSGSIIGTANQIIVTPGVGNVTLSTPQDIATTSNVTFGSLAFSPTTKGIVGTPTNDNAGVGFVGEVISSSVVSGSAVALTDSITANITSISLTAGQWMVWGTVFATGTAGAVITSMIGGISLVSATISSDTVITSSNVESGAISATVGTDRTPVLDANPAIIKLAATTTVYLVANYTFTTQPVSAFGKIIALRSR